jgi:hypothetical protein
MTLETLRHSSLGIFFVVCASGGFGFACRSDDDDGGAGNAGKGGDRGGYAGFGGGKAGAAGKAGSAGTGTGSSGKGGAGNAAAGEGGSEAGSSGDGGTDGSQASGGEGGEAISSAGAETGGNGGNSGGGNGGNSGGGSSGESGGEAGATSGGSGGESGAAGAGGGPGSSPVVTIAGEGEVVLDCGATFVEPGASAQDPEDGELPVTISGGEAVDTSAPGRFPIEYSAVDTEGNVGRATRTVNVCGPACGDLGKVPIDLTSWTKIQFEQNYQDDADWVLGSGGFAVTQTVNADASILLSNFDATDYAVEGVWRMTGSADDDFVGFVFGYQDASHFYLFDWKRGSQTHGGAFAARGMSLKIVSFATPLPFVEGKYVVDLTEFWWSVGTANVTIVQQDGAPLQNDVQWAFNQDYRFFLEFHPGSFKISVANSTGAELESWSVADSTYTNGGFGFYNYSQGPVEYQSFTRLSTPPACSTVED